MSAVLALASAGAVIAALAIPAVADAQQFEQGGSPLSPGETVTAESSNTTMLAPWLGATFSCSNITIEAEIIEDSPSGSAAAGPGSATGCLIGGMLPVRTSEVAYAIALESGGVGAAALEFTATSGEVTCTWAGEGPVTYVPGTDAIHLEAALDGPCGPVEFSGDYTLSHNGSPVTIS